MRSRLFLVALSCIIICNWNCAHASPSDKGSREKRSAQFFNDANTVVGQQVGLRSAFNNQPGAQIGDGPTRKQNVENCRTYKRNSQGRRSCCNLKSSNADKKRCNSMSDSKQNGQNNGLGNGQSSAIFVNDKETQVGQQIGPASAFNNQQAQVGRPNQNPQGQNCRLYKKNSQARRNCCNGKRSTIEKNRCNNRNDISTSAQTAGNGGRQQGSSTAPFQNDANTQVGEQIGPSSAFNNQAQIGNRPNQSQQGQSCRLYKKNSQASKNCCNGKKSTSEKNRCNNRNDLPTSAQTTGRRNQGSSTSPFQNDANTRVGQQVGLRSAFNNQGFSFGRKKRDAQFLNQNSQVGSQQFGARPGVSTLQFGARPGVSTFGQGSLFSNAANRQPATSSITNIRSQIGSQVVF